MNPRYLVDTDVIVDFLKGVGQAVEFVERNAHQMALSVIVLSELYAGARNEGDLAMLDEFLGLFPVHPVTTEIGRRGGLLKKEYSKTHGMGLADALVAATAEQEGMEIKTLNTRHYPMVRALKPAYRK